MLRLALKNVKHNPKRLILTVVAVTLGVALVAATHVVTNALDSSISGQVDDLYGGADVVVTAGQDADSNTVPDSTVATLAELDGTVAAMGVNESQVPAVLFDADGDRVGAEAGPPDLLGVWTGLDSIDLISIEDGRAPSAPGEILMSNAAAEAASASVGTVIEMAVAEGNQPMTVVGTGPLRDGVAAFGARFSAVTLDDLRLIAGPDVGYTQVFAVGQDGVDPEALAEQARAALPELTVRTGTEQAENSLGEFQAILRYVDIFSLAFAFIAVFVGAYIIVNTFRIIVTQRTRELGLLRAIGATGRQIRGMVLLEATAVGVFAGVTGIVLGWLLGLTVMGVLSLLGLAPDLGAVGIPLDAVVWGLSTGLLITLVSAALPAITASRISPMEALREHTHAVRRGLRTRNTVGGALTLLGALLVAIGLTAVDSYQWAYVAIGAIAVVIGVTLLAAQILMPLAGALRSGLEKLWGVDGRLAANNIQRESRRSANTAAALMIGVLLLSLTATFTESVKALVRDELTGVSRADLFVASQVPNVSPEALVADIEAVDGVAAASRIGFVENVELEGESISVSAVDADSAEQLFGFNTDPAFATIGEGAFVSSTPLDTGYSVGDDIELTRGDDSLTVEIVGKLTRDGDGGIFLDWATAERLTSDVLLAQTGVLLEDDADAEASREALSDMLEQKYPLMSTIAPDELLGFVNLIVDAIVGVLYALLAGAVVIAVLGVTNTLLLAVTERTREIGLLRAVGMSKKSVRRIIRIESVVMALLGAVLGSILGVVLGAAIIRALAEYGFTVIAVPWLFLLAFTVLAIVAGILAAIWPAWRASRLNILDAIAADG